MRLKAVTTTDLPRARLPPSPPARTLTHTVRVRITVQHHEVRDEDPQLPEMQVVVARWMERMGADMDKVLGTLPVALDCYFASVRTKETNAGNLLADICRESVKVCDSAQLLWGRGARTGGGVRLLAWLRYVLMDWEPSRSSL
jgi:hypothetical protein